ncbi:dihydropteroate synthase [Candidatus Pseudomonas adelgestsugas]|uniref:Dihydropteroate synthase n=1 Tax=Candidatus Pseudomonas adelgestsugas TaxID=1302376 RepID=A0ABX5R955_9PSED|nr:dihydropteroate synthase [Candidatus Pseudomonas adelgestsugas]QAX81720.1 Dihydropteroate synthase [Candidatus Pseudomonas adelgestsugas]
MTSVLSSTRLPCGNRVLDLDHTHVMGILNVTPDSFFDSSRFSQLDAALRHAEAMVAAGTALIDVGGESTRPGARVVSSLEELERVSSIVELIAHELDVIISVDTSNPAVMREAASLGAGLINDVRSLQRDGAMDAAVATGLPVCLMHMLGEPGNMQDNPHYYDLIGEVSGFLAERMAQCINAGISPEKIILDPGFGFAKTRQHNFSLLKHMESLCYLGRPLLVGVSRKSMTGFTLNHPISERLYGSLALAALAVIRGARILRVHDVAETVDIVRMLTAVESAD